MTNDGRALCSPFALPPIDAQVPLPGFACGIHSTAACGGEHISVAISTEAPRLQEMSICSSVKFSPPFKISCMRVFRISVLVYCISQYVHIRKHVCGSVGNGGGFSARTADSPRRRDREARALLHQSEVRPRGPSYCDSPA